MSSLPHYLQQALDIEVLQDMEFHWLPEWQLVCGGGALVLVFLLDTR